VCFFRVRRSTTTDEVEPIRHLVGAPDAVDEFEDQRGNDPAGRENDTERRSRSGGANAPKFIKWASPPTSS
jgi:hypothetical protein